MTAHDRFDKPFAGNPARQRPRHQPSETAIARSGPNPIDYLLSLGLLRGDAPVPAAAAAQSANAGPAPLPRAEPRFEPNFGPHSAPLFEPLSEPDAIICGVDLPTATLQAMAARLDRFVAANAQHRDPLPRTAESAAPDRQS